MDIRQPQQEVKGSALTNARMDPQAAGAVLCCRTSPGCTQGIPAGGSRVLRVPWAGHSSARARRVRGEGAVARGV